MSDSALRTGVRAGLVAAAATAGVVAAFGFRRGEGAIAFVQLGAELLANRGASSLPRSLLALVGIGTHAAVMILWGTLYSLLVRRRSPATSIGVAVIVTLTAALAAAPVLPAAVGAVRYGGLTVPHVWLSLALMAAGLVIGRALSARDH